MAPLRFREYSRNCGVAGALIAFFGLLFMMHEDASVSSMIAVSFLALALLVTGAISEAAYWLATHERLPE
jgi:hypothetical protein